MSSTALLEVVAQWWKAEDPRSYVAVAGDGANEEWTSWALGVANALDPLRRKYVGPDFLARNQGARNLNSFFPVSTTR